MNFKRFMDRSGYTVTGLSKELEVDKSTVSSWVTGRNVPKYGMCRKLLQMGMSLEELFDEETSESVLSREPGRRVADFPPGLCASIVVDGILELSRKG